MRFLSDSRNCPGSHGVVTVPGKIMLPLGDRPVLQHVLERCMAIRGKDIVVCAMPDDADHDEPEQVCQNLGVTVVKGPEDDVLARYWIAAREVQADHIMRITADCPLIDPEICRKVGEVHINGRHDYTSNVHPVRSFPRGYDCEIFTRWSLEQAYRRANKPTEREHVTPWVYNYPLFSVGALRQSTNESDLDFSLDTEEDYERIKAEYARLQACRSV